MATNAKRGLLPSSQSEALTLSGFLVSNQICRNIVWGTTAEVGKWSFSRKSLTIYPVKSQKKALFRTFSQEAQNCKPAFASQIEQKVYFLVPPHVSMIVHASDILDQAHDNRELHTSAYCSCVRHLSWAQDNHAIIRPNAKQSRSSRKRVKLISPFGEHPHSFTVASNPTWELSSQSPRAKSLNIAGYQKYQEFLPIAIFGNFRPTIVGQSPQKCLSSLNR